MDKNSELIMHIFFLQRDHSVGFRSNQLVAILYSIFCELKYQGITTEYKFSFKRWGQNPTSPEMLEVIKELVASKFIESGRNKNNELVYKLGVKGAIFGTKLPPLDSHLQNCLMGWIGYYLPISGAKLDHHLHNKFKLVNFEIGDIIPLQNPFLSKFKDDNFNDWF